MRNKMAGILEMSGRVQFTTVDKPDSDFLKVVLTETEGDYRDTHHILKKRVNPHDAILNIKESLTLKYMHRKGITQL